MEKYYIDGQEFEREYDKNRVLIYDSYNDYDESRDETKTEYDDEGYPIGDYIDTMIDPKTSAEIEAEKKEQWKTTVWVIIGFLAFSVICFLIAWILVS